MLEDWSPVPMGYYNQQNPEQKWPFCAAHSGIKTVKVNGKSFNIEEKYKGSPRDDNLETNGSSGERTRA